MNYTRAVGRRKVKECKICSDPLSNIPVRRYWKEDIELIKPIEPLPGTAIELLEKTSSIKKAPRDEALLFEVGCCCLKLQSHFYL